jgi:hypothetical protein
LKQFALNRTAILDHWHKFEEGAGKHVGLFARTHRPRKPIRLGDDDGHPGDGREALDGARLPWPLALPFAGMLLSIALGPLAVKEWWHIHYAKAAGFWAILTLGGLIAVGGLPAAAASFVHSMALEYLPFILMLFALFTAAGGISIEGRLNGSAPVNTTILAIGTVIASVIGPIVPSLILIRPLIRANSARAFNAHVVVFFIFLVANIGGVLTPVGRSAPVPWLP